jgi:hypothetical protein
MGLVLGLIDCPDRIHDNHRVVVAVLLSLAVVVQRHPYNIELHWLFFGHSMPLYNDQWIIPEARLRLQYLLSCWIEFSTLQPNQLVEVCLLFIFILRTTREQEYY